MMFVAIHRTDGGTAPIEGKKTFPSFAHLNRFDFFGGMRLGLAAPLTRHPQGHDNVLRRRKWSRVDCEVFSSLARRSQSVVDTIFSFYCFFSLQQIFPPFDDDDLLTFYAIKSM